MVMAVCENTGTAYAQRASSCCRAKRVTGWPAATAVVISFPTSTQLRDQTSRRTYPGGKAKLAVTLDDGKTLTYDVIVAIRCRMGFLLRPRLILLVLGIWACAAAAQTPPAPRTGRGSRSADGRLW